MFLQYLIKYVIAVARDIGINWSENKCSQLFIINPLEWKPVNILESSLLAMSFQSAFGKELESVV